MRFSAKFNRTARLTKRFCQCPKRRKIRIDRKVDIFGLPHILIGGESHGSDHHSINSMLLEKGNNIFSPAQ
ncbi:MAG: hypothetical protein HN341_02740 [Verrucomicrobia bacterium]|jgi:hypothetical protein|nr:hypothetical protein [Verrucomicrobiota bacterium]